MGCVAVPPSTPRRRLGDAHDLGHARRTVRALRFTRRSARYGAIPSSGARPVAASAGSGNDCRRASTTWIASPAAMASLAADPAADAGSALRLVSIALAAAPGARRSRRPACGAVQLGRTRSGRAFRCLVDLRLDAGSGLPGQSYGGPRRSPRSMVDGRARSRGRSRRPCRRRRAGCGFRQRDQSASNVGGVVGERTDTATGGLPRLDQRGQRRETNQRCLEQVGRRLGTDRKVGVVGGTSSAAASAYGRNRPGPRLGRRGRTERNSIEALPDFDRLEEEYAGAIVEQEGTRRRLRSGRPGRATGSCRSRRGALDLGRAQRLVGDHRVV